MNFERFPGSQPPLKTMVVRVGEKRVVEECWRETRGGKECCREVLEKSIAGKSWERVLWRSVGEECRKEVLEKSVEEECWRELLWRRVGEKRWREVLRRSVGEKCCGQVL